VARPGAPGKLTNGDSATRPGSRFLGVDPERFHLVPQGVAVNAESRSRSRQATFVHSQGSQQVVPLELAARLLEWQTLPDQLVHELAKTSVEVRFAHQAGYREEAESNMA
jgi:hypothetical protein